MTARDLDIGMPEKAILRKQIISDVLRIHRLGRVEFFGRSQFDELCAARKDAARRLREVGFTTGHIAKILNRERTTVLHYFDDAMAVRKRLRHREYRLLESLPEDVREIIYGVSKAERVAPAAIVREWLSERARHEFETKQRSAGNCAPISSQIAEDAVSEAA